MTITVISQGCRLVSVSVKSGDQHGGLMRVMLRDSDNSGDLREGAVAVCWGGEGGCVSWCSSWWSNNLHTVFVHRHTQVAIVSHRVSRL